jgi:putative addiction module killer protein
VPAIFTTPIFDAWFVKLRDRTAAARVQARIDRLEMGNPGDCKALGDGVLEIRIDHGPGYRVYFLRRGETIVILLVGGHKGSQAKDIDTAKRIAKQV